MGIKTLAVLYAWGGCLLMYPVFYGVVLYFFVSRASTRRHSKNYLRRAHKSWGKSVNLWLVWLHHLAFADALVYRMAAWMGRAENIAIHFARRHELLEHCRCGRGAVILTAHFGNLEMCRAVVSSGSIIRLNIVVNSRRTQSFNRLINQLDSESKINLISTESLGPATAIELQERLRQGECLIIMADRVAENSENRVLHCELFDDAILLPEGPFRLALSLQQPTYFMACVKTARNVFEVILEPLPLAHLQGARAEKMHQLCQRYLAALTELCKKFPTQWFNFYDYWNDDPAPDRKAREKKQA